jgi:hypothetical protein
MNEIWKLIPSAPGFEASSLGNIRKNGNGEVKSPCPGNDDGHIQVYIGGNRKTKMRYVHRLVAEAFHGPCPPNRVVCHSDDNPQNNIVINLYYGTRKQNYRDRVFNSNPQCVETFKVGVNMTSEEFRLWCRDDLCFIWERSASQIG